MEFCSAIKNKVIMKHEVKWMEFENMCQQKPRKTRMACTHLKVDNKVQGNHAIIQRIKVTIKIMWKAQEKRCEYHSEGETKQSSEVDGKRELVDVGKMGIGISTKCGRRGAWRRLGVRFCNQLEMLDG